MAIFRLCPECGKRFKDDSSRCDDCGTRLVTVNRRTEELDPLIGVSLEDRFVITERVGAGGMGTAYKAYQASIDRHVVVKVMHSRLLESEDAIQRFFREAKAASSLSHHHIVQIYDFGQADDGLIYIAMEYLDGVTLHEELVRYGSMSPARAVDILAQVCDALTVAHDKGIVHRDLKPDNIFLLDRPGAPDFVKVLDFGIAKMVRTSGGDPIESLTAADQIFGTPHYMSPEQVKGQPLDQRSDLYAVGVILFEMLTSSHPFDAETPVGVLMQHLSSPPPGLLESCPDAALPPELDRACKVLLSKDREDRPADAQQTKELLLSAFEDLSGEFSLPRRLTRGTPGPLQAVDWQPPSCQEMEPLPGADDPAFDLQGDPEDSVPTTPFPVLDPPDDSRFGALSRLFNSHRSLFLMGLAMLLTVAALAVWLLASLAS